MTEPGRPGELCLKGPSLFAGYLDGERAPARSTPQGYLQDRRHVRHRRPKHGQFLRYVDRAKDIIIRGGMNVAPAELETMIASHPAVAEVAVVGYPDEVLGETGVRRHGPAARAARPAPVVEHLAAQQIASYKLPERIECAEALPRNPVGGDPQARAARGHPKRRTRRALRDQAFRGRVRRVSRSAGSHLSSTAPGARA